MKLLALETSTDACSIALSCDGEVLVNHQIAQQKHVQLLLPAIDHILVDAGIKTTDLDGVAFGCGPGSFTGVRIAAAATQGIAYGADIGVVPVSSLQALAQGHFREQAAEHILASFDARMNEIYWGAYTVDSVGIAQPISADCLCAPNLVTMPSDVVGVNWALVGSGADQYPDISAELQRNSIMFSHVSNCWPNAQDVLTVAQSMAASTGFLSAADAMPVYLRERVALTEVERANGERL